MKTPWRLCFALRHRLPSCRLNPFADNDRRVRLLAVTMVRDEIRFLPGLLRNLAPQVDGIIALDDGSSDGSDLLLEECPQVLELLRNSPGRPGWDQPGNHRRLVEAALRHGADWIIAVDADERLERDFRTRAERVIRRGGPIGLTAYGVHFRELWNGTAHSGSTASGGGRPSPAFFRRGGPPIR